jgi:hypothetical protein
MPDMIQRRLEKKTGATRAGKKRIAVDGEVIPDRYFFQVLERNIYISSIVVIYSYWKSAS